VVYFKVHLSLYPLQPKFWFLNAIFLLLLQKIPSFILSSIYLSLCYQASIFTSVYNNSVMLNLWPAHQEIFICRKLKMLTLRMQRHWKEWSQIFIYPHRVHFQSVTVCIQLVMTKYLGFSCLELSGSMSNPIWGLSMIQLKISESGPGCPTLISMICMIDKRFSCTDRHAIWRY